MTHQILSKTFKENYFILCLMLNSSTEIIDRTLENALFCVTKTIDKIMTGEIETARLDYFKAT